MSSKSSKKNKKPKFPEILFRYFAYGSNMSHGRIINRLGKVIKVGVAELKDYTLTFNYGNDTESYANIIESPGDSVKGVVYLLTHRQLLRLDLYEGTVIDADRFYKRVIKSIDDKQTCVYISHNIRKEFMRPVYERYLNHILKGYTENGLTFDKQYLEIIKKHVVK